MLPMHMLAFYAYTWRLSSLEGASLLPMHMLAILRICVGSGHAGESRSRWSTSKRDLECELSLNRVAFHAYAWAFHAYAWMDDARGHAEELVLAWVQRGCMLAKVTFHAYAWTSHAYAWLGKAWGHA
ncbi:hypothetical protein PIB30_101130 [Stylosanthes scabra]|uniref:Uncharacterized protein n=1 Tax=Stylosanthes scabra TaxID=79078 RepID=A0ABU6XZP3_9FABA|nr:hypothetical protein [Stylosanthes scabra]